LKELAWVIYFENKRHFGYSTPSRGYESRAWLGAEVIIEPQAPPEGRERAALVDGLMRSPTPGSRGLRLYSSSGTSAIEQAFVVTSRELVPPSSGAPCVSLYLRRVCRSRSNYASWHAQELFIWHTAGDRWLFRGVWADFREEAGRLSLQKAPILRIL